LPNKKKEVTMSQEHQQWVHVVPEGGRVYQELQEGEWIVWCTAPTPAPDPELPESSGTWEGDIGVHHIIIDWEYKDGAYNVTDVDVIVSLDEEIG
jgi:hypothetical protein